MKFRHICNTTGFRHILLAAALLLTSCTYHSLKNIEGVMETAPAAADTLLAAIPVPQHARSRALHAILRTQIDYKLYRKAESDSLIRIATGYYGTRRKSYHAAMAWYSLGCVAGESGDDVTSADAYLKAMSLFPDTLVRYYALSQQNLGNIYLYHKLDEEAISILKACRTNSERLNDSVAIAFCDYNIAMDLLHNRQFQESRALFSELMESRWVHPETKDKILLQMAKIVLHCDNDHETALCYIDSFISTDKHVLPYGLAYSLKADVFYGLQQMDSAKLYYTKSLSETQDPNTLYCNYSRLSDIAYYNSDKEQADFFSDKANEWLDSIAIGSESSKFLISPIHTFKNGNDSKKWLACCIIFCVTLAFIVFMYHGKNRKNHAKDSTNKKHAASIADFSESLDIFRQHEFYQTILVFFTKDIITSRELNEIKHKFHSHLIEVRSFLTSKYSLSIPEADLCILVLLGIKQKRCHLFYSLSESGTRTMKYRIKNKMPSSEFEYIFAR